MPSWPTVGAWPAAGAWPSVGAWPTAGAWPVGGVFNGNFASLFSNVTNGVQPDLGLTYGGTLLDAGGIGPVVTLTGAISGNPIPILLKCTLAGALGVWTYAVYYDGGVTPAMTGVSASAIPLTGLGAGATLNLAAGAAILNNTWTATYAGSPDTSGSGNPFAQPTSGFQPIVTPGLNGNVGLLFDGVDDTIDSIFTVSPASAAPTFQFCVWRMTAYNAIGIQSGATAGSPGTVNILSVGANPQYSQFSPTANTNAAITLGNWSCNEAWFFNGVAAYFRQGATPVSGTAVNGVQAGTGRQISNSVRSAGRFQNMEFLLNLYMSALPSAPQIATARAAVTARWGGAVAV